MTCSLEILYSEENGEHYITIPSEILERLGWSIGDEIEFTDLKNGSFRLTKINKTECTKGAIDSKIINVDFSK